MKNANVILKNLFPFAAAQPGTLHEFTSLDSALRGTPGTNPNGDRFNQMLLTKPGKLTYKDAQKRMIENGWEVVQRAKAEWSKTGTEILVAASEEKEPGVVEVSVHVEETKVVKTESTLKHFQFGILLELISAHVNALLVGPAGSGKTTAAEVVAQTLSLRYFSISVGMQTTKTEFFGYMNATGDYVRTLFREAYEHGGVFLIDEMDAGNANVMTSINQALANKVCAFPDGMVQKHDDFTIMASANTYGTGANREYVGRNQLDAATLDRFAVIQWDYDMDMENALASNKNWLKFVRTCRANAEKYKIRTVVSPRASINGSKLLAQGVKPADVMNTLLRKGMNDTDWAKLIEGADVASLAKPLPIPNAAPKTEKKEDKKTEQEESDKGEDSKGAESESSEKNGDGQNQKDKPKSESQPKSPTQQSKSSSKVSAYEKMAVEEPKKLKDMAINEPGKFDEMKHDHEQTVRERTAQGFPSRLSADEISRMLKQDKEVERHGDPVFF